jgi:RNA polymerase sigma-70 factor (ECF subfamily)
VDVQHPEDLDLAQRVAGGDRAAFEAFFGAYFPRLYRFALRRAGNDHDAAEDVVQAALIRALDRLDQYRGEASLFVWLCTVCRRELADQRMRGRITATAEPILEDQPAVRAALELIADGASVLPEGDPPRASQLADLRRLIQATLDHLPVHYGDALEWKYVLELSTAEIAGRLGMSVKAAESLLTRARDAFRAGFTDVVALDDALDR